MKYVITGSLGNISKPIVELLIKSGHDVSVISSRSENKPSIEDLGAVALVGSVENSHFINDSFAGADAVYLMIPQNFAAPDFYGFQQKVTDNYITAVQKNHIKNIVVLSSIGAHMRKGAGPIDGLGYLEERLENMQGLNLLFLRPSYFFNNLYSQVGLAKNAGIFGANHGGEEKLVLTDTDEVARIGGEALLKLYFKGRNIRYIANDERSVDEIAAALGNAIGKEGTPWVVFTDEQSRQGMLDAGLPPTMANAYTQMGKSIHEGLIQEDYWKNRPILGQMKLEDFAKKFASAYSA